MTDNDWWWSCPLSCLFCTILCALCVVLEWNKFKFCNDHSNPFSQPTKHNWNFNWSCNECTLSHGLCMLNHAAFLFCFLLDFWVTTIVDSSKNFFPKARRLHTRGGKFLVLYAIQYQDCVENYYFLEYKFWRSCSSKVQVPKPMFNGDFHSLTLVEQLFFDSSRIIVKVGPFSTNQISRILCSFLQGVPGRMMCRTCEPYIK